MSDLLQLIIESGLIQFGTFPRDGTSVPVQFHLDMLASYPDVLDATAEALRLRLPVVDRLFCAPDAVPLGVALALKTGIPLVYSKGGEREPVHDLIGAYDIGHPAVFVTNVAGNVTYTPLLTSARRVGLDVQSMVAVIDLGIGTALPVAGLLRLSHVVNSLVERGMLPQGQATAVNMWIEAQVAVDN